MNHQEAQLNRFRLAEAGSKAWAVIGRHQALEAHSNRNARIRELRRVRKDLEAMQDAWVLAYEACIALHESVHKDIVNFDQGTRS